MSEGVRKHPQRGKNWKMTQPEEQTDNFIVRKEKGIENDGLIYTGLHHTAFLQQGK